MHLASGKNDAYDTWYSQAVPHPSTNQAQRCLTSQIGRDAVCSTWYGRRQFLGDKVDLKHGQVAYFAGIATWTQRTGKSLVDAVSIYSLGAPLSPLPVQGPQKYAVTHIAPLHGNL